MATAMYDYYGHAPRFDLSHAHLVSHAPSMTSLHLRSQSMPEAVYHQQQLIKASKPRPHNQYAPPPRPHPSGLRRSHTNVADLNRLQYSQQRAHEQGLYHARSRSNIAALEANFSRPRPPTSINRASSFYHHRSMGFLASNSRSSVAFPPSTSTSMSMASLKAKDLGQPLHVDCSVEYDLGIQPKIPKDSAPLLIIHPAFMASEAAKVRPKRVARHSSFLVTSPPKLEAAKRPDFGSLFHLSMPDIAASEALEAETSKRLMATEPAKLRPTLHNKKAQHKHFEAVLPAKARVNLSSKLEAVRKLSSDSGASLEKHVIQPNIKPLRSGLCDSGLGTPISLLDEASMASTSTSSNNSGKNSLKSKWASSMTGLVSGFFCCSPGLASIEVIKPRMRPRMGQMPAKRPQNKYVVQQPQNVFICAPDQHQQMTSMTSSFWNDDVIMTSSPMQRYSGSSASNSTSSVASGSTSNYRRPFPNSVSICRYCQSTNPGEDCKDGFCSKVWNKENGGFNGSLFMRPIHI